MISLSFNDFVNGVVNEGSDNYDFDLLSIFTSIDTGNIDIDFEDDYIILNANKINSQTLDDIVDNLPDEVEFELYNDDENNTKHLVIFTDNFTDNYPDIEEILYKDVPSDGVAPIQLDEIKRVIKVNNKGKRSIKLRCNKGYKLVNGACKLISGTEKITRRKAAKKTIRTKKSKGAGFKKRVSRLTRIAKRKRKSMGIK